MKVNIVSENFYWYKLFRTPGAGDKSINIIYEKMLRKNLKIQTIFEMNEAEFIRTFPQLKRVKFNDLKSFPDEIYKEYEQLKRQKIEIIHLGHELYPKNLIERMKLIKDNPPPILFCKGYIHALKDGGISIVGSRNADNKTLDIAKKLASELVRKGINVISGYAKGVDKSAHLGALENDGITVMVLSYGIFKFKNEFKLYNSDKNILAISQFAPNDDWKEWKAMKRNKVICGLSKAVIVVSSGPPKDEKGKMSGSFDAGKVALDMKVPLFVIDPEILPNKPIGNRMLIELGGIKISPENAVEVILNHISNL